MNSAKSKELYEKAKKYVPGGASSNVRVTEEHAPFPTLFKTGQGSKVKDVDGNEYLDYLLSYGALILGHRHPRIIDAIRNQLSEATMIGTTTELEIHAAKKVCELVPCADMVKFCTTGTEATMNAIRIARAYTGREKIVKFEGHYHGHHDYVLYSVVADPMFAGLENAPSKLPWFPGIPGEVAQTVIVAPWNKLSLLERALKKNTEDTAAVIMEPIMANNSVIVPNKGYLEGVRELTQKYGVVLIFDEVFTGFRVAKGGAQEYLSVTPDLACFSKALGGGVPIAAVAGAREIMEMLVPGKIGFAGTYNANPLSLAACLAVLEELSRNDGEALREMRSLGTKLADGLQATLESTGHDGIVPSVGAMFSILFTELAELTDYRQWTACDLEKFKEFRDLMLKERIYLHPDGMERIVLSTAHTQEDIERTLAAAEDILRKLPK